MDRRAHATRGHWAERRGRGRAAFRSANTLEQASSNEFLGDGTQAPPWPVHVAISMGGSKVELPLAPEDECAELVSAENMSSAHEKCSPLRSFFPPPDFDSSTEDKGMCDLVGKCRAVS